MRQNVKPVLVLLTVLMCGAFLASQVIAAPPSSYGDENVITGTVTENLRIVADDGKEYAAIGAKAKDLMNNIGERVEIRGLLLQSSGGRLVEIKDITVKSKEEMKK